MSEFTFTPEYLGTAALAIGALGTASYGIVDGLKLVPWLDLAGFERIFAVGGKEGGRRWPTKRKAALDPLLPALRIAYGKDVMELLRAQYRGGRVTGDLPRTLRQGVRIGFGMMEIAAITSVAVDLGIKEDIAVLAAQAIDDARRQRAAALQVEESMPPQQPAMTEEQRSAMARLETTIDARIDAALALADTQYVTQTKLLAMAVSLAISFLVGWGIGMLTASTWAWCLIVGLAAVPLSPVAKDLSTALQEAVKALKVR
ncbi:MAG: hypothetical protein NW701_06835 [Nitrospira sp.]